MENYLHMIQAGGSSRALYEENGETFVIVDGERSPQSHDVEACDICADE